MNVPELIEFEEYDKDLSDHVKVVDILAKDEETINRFNDFYKHIDEILSENSKCRLFVARIHDDLLGLISIRPNEKDYEIAYDLLPDKRSAGVGSLLVDIFSYRILKYVPNIGNLYMNIVPENELNRVIASRSGFTKLKGSRYIRENHYK